MLNGFPDNFRMGDDDVLNEFRQKQANFDLEEKRNEINNSRSLFIGALAGLAMAAVVGWFVLAPQYQSSEEEEVPVIRRPGGIAGHAGQTGRGKDGGGKSAGRSGYG